MEKGDECVREKNQMRQLRIWVGFDKEKGRRKKEMERECQRLMGKKRSGGNMCSGI